MHQFFSLISYLKGTKDINFSHFFILPAVHVRTKCCQENTIIKIFWHEISVIIAPNEIYMHASINLTCYLSAIFYTNQSLLDNAFSYSVSKLAIVDSQECLRADHDKQKVYPLHPTCD